jgi:hypothetical protein
MDLKDFIRETLLQIQRGIGEAQTELYGKYQGVIAPLFKPIENLTDADMEWVEFDVAITVTEGAEKDIGGKLNIAAMSLGGSGKKSHESESVSRVKFRVPIVSPKAPLISSTDQC